MPKDILTIDYKTNQNVMYKYNTKRCEGQKHPQNRGGGKSLRSGLIFFSQGNFGDVAQKILLCD